MTTVVKIVSLLPTMEMEMVSRTTTMKRGKGARDNEMLKGMTSAESCWSKRRERSKRGWTLLLETIELHIVQWTLENICPSVVVQKVDDDEESDSKNAERCVCFLLSAFL